jgi:hypothetical protein
MGQLSNSRLKSIYLKSDYDILSYTKDVYKEDFIDNIYYESNKAASKKTRLGEVEFFRVKCGFEGIDMMDPYITLLISNFKNHIIYKHPEMDRWKIIAVLCEPDVVYQINEDSKKGIFYFIERDIEGGTARVVVNRNKQGVLYVVTAYVVETNPEKEAAALDITERTILYSNLV